MTLRAPQRCGRWTVFTDRDGNFAHARHDNPRILIAWTFAEWFDRDGDAARRFEGP